MVRVTRLAGVALLAFIATGCASTMSVSSHVARDVDFARYQTYDWGKADALPVGDTRFDRSRVFHDHVQGEVERALALRGLKGPTSRKPQLLLHYHASINRRIDADTVNKRYVDPLDHEYYGSGGCYDCEIDVVEREVATLTLDVLDARTKKLLWRGWAQDPVGDLFEDSDRMQSKIHEAVSRMMEQFPAGRLARTEAPAPATVIARR